MAGISDSTREQIRAANDIVEVIGAVVPLKRAGVNFIGLCPFHREKTPSFNVNPSRQMFKCFGCGKGGDVFTFVKEYENLTFPEAMRRLAERAHIVIKEEETPGSGETRQIKEKLFTIHEQITQRWQTALNSDPGSQIAREYLAKRGVPDEAVKLFRIGYAPDAWDDTVNWAKSKSFELDIVAQAGLIIKRDTGDGYYDRFRGRLMFPICDEQGRVVAFSGRILVGDEKSAKYVNSPETSLFTKGRIIFGLDKAKRAILDRQFAVVCEGQLDMIACYMAGVENTVAPQGTAFTGEQARLLKRYTKELVLCFDSDNAGQKAAVRALDDLLASGLAIRVASVPAPHDPDSYIKSFGAQAFTDLITKGVGYFDFYLEYLCRNNDVASERGQREIARAMATALAKTGDGILFDRYARHTALKLGVDPINAVKGFQKLARDAAPAPRPQTEDPLPSEIQEAEIPRPTEPEFVLLQLTLCVDEFLPWMSQHLDLQWIQHEAVKEILGARMHQKDDSSFPEPAELLHNLSQAAQAIATEVVTAKQRSASQMLLEHTLATIRNSYLDKQILSLIPRTAVGEVAEQREVFRILSEMKRLRAGPLRPISDASEF